MIYVCRHGKTRLNSATTEDDKIRGWLDVPLTKEGIEEAHGIADELKDKGIKRIYASDMDRTRKTADILGDKIGVEPSFSKEFRPWNLGKFQGKPTKDVMNDINYYIQNSHLQVPDGESFKEFQDRFLNALKGIMSEKITCAIVTHFRNTKLVESWIKNGQKGNTIDKNEMKKDGVSTGGILELHS